MSGTSFARPFARRIATCLAGVLLLGTPVAVVTATPAAAALAATVTLNSGPSAVLGSAGNVATFTITNNTSGPDTSPAFTEAIRLLVSCGALPVSIVCGTNDTGLIQPSATGIGSGSCAGISFAITLNTGALYDLTPDAYNEIPAGGTCTISFTYSVQAMPTIDAAPAVPGSQTYQSASADLRTTLDGTPFTGTSTPSLLTILKATPALSTTSSAGFVIGSGGTLSDTATITGGFTPTGTVTFDLFGPDDATCANPAAFTSAANAIVGGTSASATFAPTVAGTYRWIAHYSGDGNNNAVDGACNDANESVVVARVTPTLSTTASAAVSVGGNVSDQATLSGGYLPTGTITFNLYGPNDPTCTNPAAFTSAVPVAGNGAYGSGNFAPASGGVYRWVASYGGDANNNPATGACNDLNESVSVWPVIRVAKTATPLAQDEPGGSFTFDIVVTNDGPAAVTITALTDDVYGNVGTLGTCTTAIGTVIPASGGTYSCSFVGVFTGNAGDSQTDTVTATAIDALANIATSSDSATVTLTDALPSLTVTKTPSPSSRFAPGGPVTFTVNVANVGPEAITITTITDDVYGDLATQGTCTTAVGTVIAISGTYSCSFTQNVTGAGGSTHTDTVTVTAVDDEGNIGSNSGSATVTLALDSPPIPPTPSVTPTASPTGTPAPTASGTPAPVPGVTCTDIAEVDLGADVTQITAGNTPTLTGIVHNAAGQTCAGALIVLTKKAHGDTAFSPLATMTSDANGRLTLVVRPMVLTTYSATTPDGVDRSQLVNIRVYIRVVLTDPLDPVPAGSSRPVVNPVVFVGRLSPAYAGVAVGLGTYIAGRFVVLQQVDTDGSGGFAFTRNLRSGPGTYVVFTSAHGGNDKGAKSVALEVT